MGPGVIAGLFLLITFWFITLFVVYLQHQTITNIKISIMKTLSKTLENVSVEELKKVAIAYKDDLSMEGIIIANKVNSVLIEKMSPGQFKEFSEKELW